MTPTQRQALIDVVRAERALEEKKRRALGMFAPARLRQLGAHDLAALRASAESLPDSLVKEELLDRLCETV